MQHSGATQVEIRIADRDDGIELSVTDNGKGFDHNMVQNFGMRNMQGRADYMNGELIIDSGVDKGTVITVRVNRGIPTACP
jgi:signal transduction histidine kinase